MSPVDIIHLGAEDCVTGSCHMVRFRRQQTDADICILVDCGTAYGRDPQPDFDQFPVPTGKIDFLFLTHAHIDHIGRVPDLIAAGFKGEIICTHATKALLIPMLRDAMSFSGRSDGQILDLEKRIDDLSWGFELNEVFSLGRGIRFKLGNAGHILGSCFIQFWFPCPSSSDYRVTFSGDLGCIDTPILPDPDIPDACDLLILESTYGDRRHAGRKERVETLAGLLDKALSDNGIVYIPAFALGRTQELIYELDRIKTTLPVFVDSPLGLGITKIYASLEDFWDQEAKDLKARGDHPIDFKSLYAVDRFRDHRALLDIKGPAVIIAGSGMCTGGRILDHLEKGLQVPENDVFFVGYQAKGTLGRRILDGKTKVNACVNVLSGYSAHADQEGLVNWVRSMPELPGEIKLVHGEPLAQKTLAKALSSVA